MQHGDRNNPLLDYGFPENPSDPALPRKYQAGLQASWETRASAVWVQTGATAFRWHWRSEILDLHPRFRTSAELATEFGAVPINRDAALGGGTYMHILVYTEGATQVPLIGGLQCRSFECANDQAPIIGRPAPATPQISPLFLVGLPTDVTDTLREGGVDTVIDGVVYRGASVLAFSPPAENVRFWQVWLEFTFDATVAADPNALGLALQASVY